MIKLKLLSFYGLEDLSEESLTVYLSEIVNEVITQLHESKCIIENQVFIRMRLQNLLYLKNRVPLSGFAGDCLYLAYQVVGLTVGPDMMRNTKRKRREEPTILVKTRAEVIHRVKPNM